MSYLRKGVAGAPVKILQTKLGVPADGEFGPATETALKAFQQSHGLASDGVAGPDTFLKMGLGELVLLATGVSGEAVKTLQQALNLPADGQFGPATEKALKAFQSAHGLEADGLAGPDTPRQNARLRWRDRRKAGAGFDDNADRGPCRVRRFGVPN